MIHLLFIIVSGAFDKSLYVINKTMTSFVIPLLNISPSTKNVYVKRLLIYFSMNLKTLSCSNLYFKEFRVS